MIQNRTVAFLTPVILISAALLVVLAIVLPHLAGAVVVEPAHPIQVATATADNGWSLVEQYGPLWGGALLAFGLGGALLKRNESAHWLGQGRALAIATGAVSVLGAVLEWRLQGGASAGVLVTAVMALKLVLSPSANPAPAPSSSSSASGSVGMLAVLLVGAGLALQPGCATTRARGTAAAGALIDCQASNLLAAVAELVPLAKQAVLVAIGGTGHVDFAQLRAAAAPLKSDLGRCALAAAIAATAAPPPEQPGAPAAAPAAAPLAVDGPELRAAFAAIRSELGWPAVRVAEGTVL